ncbi:UDP-N-acetylglucosamine--N-acetylmuramyl-(pentapeptide) pyrophosphoryl-undecaprenol N-acetylglucosamine transferase [Bacteroidia bacterium]|nr:UDP-N-acetylglucosamine--N-acetylmuramyl-(pentapeptide) pyrophosphoryl-undecaprenol N-acetylglucosamine transferase [Bacteroidia bacterium]
MAHIIISGGGTGGHIFPAISIARALQDAGKSIQILFVGAEGRMEMEKVPAAGYAIKGLPIAGIQRNALWKNVKLPFKILRSLNKASKIISDFKPDAVVGVGGYASAPVLWVAQNKGIPTLIQEQNSYAGLSNKLLARRAKKICVAYEGMERFFKKRKIIFTGNPVRQDLQNVGNLRSQALAHFGLDANKKTIVILGGSLGARTLNQSVLAHWQKIVATKQIQVIWQVGKLYEKLIAEQLKNKSIDNIHIVSFIQRMDYAFAAADLVISRAGAGTISELCVVGKPCILVPSPNVSEDHQTKNAMALVQKQAAVMVTDTAAPATLIHTALHLLQDSERLQGLAKNIAALALPDAAKEIAQKVLQLIDTQGVKK